MKRTRNVVVAAVCGAGLSFGGWCAAAQTVTPDYDTARDSYFWPLLYDIGGRTVYCDKVFEAGFRETLDGREIWLEHAYPAQWMAEANGCPDREDCPVEAFQRAVADLHNLWPALRGINTCR